MKNKYLKIVFSIIMAFVSSAVLYTAVSLQSMQDAFDDELYGNVIRLHILADSDSDEDQYAKILVRDAVKEYIYSLVEKAGSKIEAETMISQNIDEIENTVAKAINELGLSCESTVSFDEEYYPVRYYDGFAFPSGKYKSLKISLGSGKGKNWWCVLYPTVCNSMSADTEKKLTDSGVSQKTADMICSGGKKYEFGIYLLDLFRRKS